MALNQNLTNFWKLDETTGNRVDSVGSVDLSPNNSPGSGTGKNGNAVKSASTTDWIDNTVDNLGAATITIAAWIKRTTSTDDKAWIISRGNPSGFALFPEFGDLVIEDGDISSHILVSALSADTWHLVAAKMVSGTELGLSVDGAAWDTVGWAGSIAANTTTRVAYNVSLQSGEELFVDELAIWDRALTNAELTSLYNSGTGNFGPWTLTLDDADVTVDAENVTWPSFPTDADVTVDAENIDWSPVAQDADVTVDAEKVTWLAAPQDADVTVDSEDIAWLAAPQDADVTVDAEKVTWPILPQDADVTVDGENVTFMLEELPDASVGVHTENIQWDDASFKRVVLDSVAIDSSALTDVAVS